MFSIPHPHETCNYEHTQLGPIQYTVFIMHVAYQYIYIQYVQWDERTKARCSIKYENKTKF